jgi:ribosomal protein S18 acetylase RimI-like enzyme
LRDGLVLKQRLNAQELTELRELADLCEARDNISLKLNWEMLRERPEGQVNDLLYYVDGKLAAFLGIYILVFTESELSGMVHPDNRRRGIFTQMTEAALGLLSGRRTKHVIYICPRNSASGAAFLKNRDVPYSFSEYAMERTDLGDVRQQQGRRTDIRLRESGPGDLKLLTELNRVGFDLEEREAEEFALATTGPQEMTYLIESGKRAVGKVGVQLEGDMAFIFGFCVRPEARGGGIGRAALAETIARLQQERGAARFQLEVAVDNERALELYESCGFRRLNIIDYYKTGITESILQ